MHGIGNDFVMVDNSGGQLGPVDMGRLSVQVCDRRFGIGSDGLISVERDSEVGLAMRMWNPDGSESEMCGNGVRCFALYVQQLGLVPAGTIRVRTGAGVLELETVGEGLVRVDMGRARLTRGEIGMSGSPDSQFVGQPVDALGAEHKATAVGMGNPHLVIFVADADAIDLDRIGPVLEHHELFPERVNVHFAHLAGRDHLVQRTWERGAGRTLACGTGACATACAAFLNGLTGRDVRVSLPGGDLRIEYGEDGRVFMTGPAEFSFTGEFSAEPDMAGV